MSQFTMSFNLADAASGVGITCTRRWTGGNDMDVRRLDVGTTEEEITIATAVGDAHVLFFKNNDGTNYIEMGFSTGDYKFKILPGDFVKLSVQTALASVFVKANTAACSATLIVTEA